MHFVSNNVKDCMDNTPLDLGEAQDHITAVDASAHSKKTDETYDSFSGDSVKIKITIIFTHLLHF